MNSTIAYTEFVEQAPVRLSKAQQRRERVESREVAESIVVGTVRLPDGTDHSFTLLDLSRFMSKTEQVDGHLLWTGATTHDGYGAIRVGGHVMYTHRVLYQLVNGPIPDGLQLDHLCRIRRCATSKCLEPVTVTENVLRGESGSAVNARKTHCHNGHEFSPENTRVRLGRNGRVARACVTCQAERDAARRKRAA